ncbi:MAG: hypothetical protein LUH51_08705 [Firmicutes bacterium]|nr:hypothetical protein [Bacillota bacterium]
MIDIHCHILPGVDDGSESTAVSMQMAAMAADDAITDIIATPHVTWDRQLDAARMEQLGLAEQELRLALAQSGLPVRCHFGAEVLLAEDDPALLPGIPFPRMAGTDYALVEFFFDERADYMTSALEKIAAAGIHPIVAHPERYDAAQRDRKLLLAWAQAGFALQINCGSPGGSFGRRAQKTARWMLERQAAAFVASDAHGLGGRTTKLRAPVQALAKDYGTQYLNLLTVENPRRLLANAPLAVGAK